MTRDDIPKLVTLWLQSYPGELVAQTTAAEVCADWTAAFNNEYGLLNYPASLLIEQDGEVIAAVQTVVNAVWDDTPPGPFIIEMIVHPTWQQRGIGRAILRQALAALPIQGFHTVALRAEKDNTPAQCLYRSIGFTDWRH